MKTLISIQHFLAAQLSLVLAFYLGKKKEDDSQRGDVPGWVMITMMTAILVAGLLVVAKDALINMFNNAMSMIGG